MKQAPVLASPDAPDAAPPAVRVTGLNKTFARSGGSLVAAIDNTSFEVQPGEFVVLLGPSGCGKTTLLRCVAGLEDPDGGTIEIGGREVFSAAHGLNLAPDKRSLSMIFQSYALWPHMSVFKNVAYPLDNIRPRLSKQTIKERVNTVLGLVGISDLGGQYPNQLSGGQQQRVALARALVSGSHLVLFDEPLSNVDAKVREQLRYELAKMQRELNFSALYVTHDQAEAMQLADRIAVIGNGVLRQLGTPREIYEEPSSRYVANFIGTTNELVGQVCELDGDWCSVDTAIGVVRGQRCNDVRLGQSVVALWRPERTRLESAAPDGQPNWWTGELETTMYVGTHVEQVVRVGDLALQRWAVGDLEHRGGDTVWLGVEPEFVRVLSLGEPAIGDEEESPDDRVDVPAVVNPVAAVSAGA